MPFERPGPGDGFLDQMRANLLRRARPPTPQTRLTEMETENMRGRTSPPHRATRHIFDIGRLKGADRAVNEAEIRALCSSAYLGDHWALCRVLGRYKMYVDTRDIGLSSHLMLDGYWEMWLSEELVGCIQPGMTVVDAGANLGYFTLIMADRVGPKGLVHAFEPNPPIAHRMIKSLEVNGFRSRVTVHPEPLGDKNDREVILVAPSDEPKNAYVTHEGVGLVLKTRRLDSFPEILDADVIKIDAEGAELDIWHGMSGLLERRSRPQTIFLEYAAARYADPGDFLREIVAAGFSLAEVSFGEGIQPRTEAQILAAPPNIDQMLVLRR